MPANSDPVNSPNPINNPDWHRDPDSQNSGSPGSAETVHQPESLSGESPLAGDKDPLAQSVRNHDVLAYKLGCVVRLGSLLLGAGASSFRVKASMAKLAKSLGIEQHQAMVSTTEIVASAYSDGTFRTEMAEQRRMGVNADLIDRLNRFVKSLTGPRTVPEATSALDQIQKSTKSYPAVLNMLASGVACAGFSFLNGGTPLQLLSVFVAASAGQVARRMLIGRGFNHIAVWMLCAGIATALYIAFLTVVETIFPSAGVSHGGVIAACLFLVPGFPLLTALLELIRQDLSAAVPRVVYCASLIVGVGIAIWAVTSVAGWPMTQDHVYSLSPLIQASLNALATFVAAYGFAMLFNSPSGACLASALIGMVVNFSRLIAIDMGVARITSTAIAALAIGLLAAGVARLTRYSRVSLSVPGAVVMIPGVYLYQGVADLSVSESVGAFQALTEVSLTVVAIGAGLAVARMLTDKNWLIDRPTSIPEVAVPRGN